MFLEESAQDEGLSLTVGNFVGLPKFQGMRRTSIDARGLQALVQAILAEVAFERLFCGLVHNRNVPWAGLVAGLASHAQFRLNKDDSILSALSHGACGTGKDAPRRIAVETGHK
jgi:hypothetical protein